MKRFSSVTVSYVLFVVSVVLFVLLMREMSINRSELTSKSKKPESVKDRMSYAYGVVAYRELKHRGSPFDVEQFITALKSAAAGGESLLSDQEIEKAFKDAEKALEEKQESSRPKSNKELGQEFLAENAKKEGVITTASGLQYEVINPSDGPKPKSTDTVTVHYHGTLIDGTVFDSSVQRGMPATFPLDQVIAGWTEGVALMSKGAKYRFFIPQELAYGSRGAGGAIKPYSALIFEVELLEIK